MGAIESKTLQHNVFTVANNGQNQNQNSFISGKPLCHSSKGQFNLTINSNNSRK